jgi:hypothetical protein
MSRPVVFALALGLSAGAFVCEAEAQESALDDDWFLRTNLGALPAGMASITMLGLDIAYGAHGELFPPGWAAFELLVSVGDFAIAGLLLYGAQDQGWSDAAPIATAAVFGTFGLWFLIHSLWSFAWDGGEEEEDPPPVWPPPVEPLRY